MRRSFEAHHARWKAAAAVIVMPLTAAVLPASGDVGVEAEKLLVIQKPGKAKVVFVSKDPGITKGSGTDLNDISATFDVAYDAAGGSFSIPAGEFTATEGWKANKDTVAKYLNKAAPAGSTGVKVAIVKPSKLFKLVAKSLGDDAGLDIFGQGAPSGVVSTTYCVTNGGVETCHCSTFTDCTYKLIAGDTGAKLLCKTATSDPSCGAVLPTGPCGGSEFPTCSGTCPTGETCQAQALVDLYPPLTGCACQPESAVCSGTGVCLLDAQCGFVNGEECPSVLGVCPEGEVCALSYPDSTCSIGFGGATSYTLQCTAASGSP